MVNHTSAFISVSVLHSVQTASGIEWGIGVMQEAITETETDRFSHNF